MSKYNKSEIMKEAHQLYKSNKRMGWAWALRVSWMISNQLGRRNLNPIQISRLRGLRYEAERNIDAFKGNQHTIIESGGGNIYHHQNKTKTAEKLADEYGVSERTIRNDAYYGD